MIDSVVNYALDNLSRLLVSEVTLLSSVKDQIRSLNDELKFMNIFIKSSEGKREDPFVKEVVNQIRNVAYQAEDVVDTYVVNVNNQRRRNMLGKFFHSKDHVMMFHEVSDQINSIKRRIDEIYQNKSKYGIQQGDFESHTGNKEFAKDSLIARRRDVEEEEVVGLVHDSDEVINHLARRGDSSRRVVCILGMGGLGKTTLARKIYNSNKIKSMFQRHVWGFVSNDYRAQKLLLSLLKFLGLSTEEYKDLTDKEKMKRKVRECMSGKKYLVVLDDIWNIQVWDELQEAFPDENNGSRILITTRIEDISHYSRATFTYRLPFLDESQSWELFCKKVFGKEKCPHELEVPGKEMANACKGLPLAIIVLAGMVAKKERSPREWLKIKNHVSWYLVQEEEYRIVTNILKLSYDDLPQTLKPCFLYLGVYPEDYEIHVRRLCQLWIAEGFIQKKEVGPSNSLEVEDIADMYLDKLVERSLVQVASRRSDGGVKTCRVHDLLRDLCISESRENKFMEVCTNLDAIKCNSRRMSLQYRGELRLTEDTQSSARSLLLFGESTFWENESQGWKQIRNDFKLARVLDMNQVLLCLSPRGLKTLIHLRFLKVTASSTRIGNDVLASLCNLWNLETLYLWIEEPITLPNKIWKLKSLRHVYLDIDVYSLKKMWHIGASISKMKIGETKVENLQTLNNIYLNARTASVLKKGMFPNLTKLTLRKGPPEKEFLENSLRCLNKLRTLKLLCIEKLPLDPNAYPTNLTKITIGYFPQLDARMIKTLGRLSKLQILKLVDGGIYGDVNCVAGDFPQLQVLHLSEVQLDGRWKVEEGAMPQIRYCNDPLILDLER
ncbi:disease resistance protein RPP13-like [Arachis stenosperma]|uniref:disease resistance protein RPP13-like n=1 Tax=Arachis stenosperma TaxID=217475 RepID=UPI0025AD39E0|nr:disease resistance protein RPP13-like [Arachis stenosperma]